MVVYWSFIDYSQEGLELNTFKPESVFKNLSKSNFHLKGDAKSNYTKCPAYSNYFKNTFVIKAHKDYDLEKVGKTVTTSDTNVSILEKNLFQRDNKNSIYDILWYYSFTCEDNIEISQYPATLHKNNFTENTRVFSGRFNISKWFRPLTLSFIMDSKKINIKRGDVLYYVKFHTEEKIIFKNYQRSDKINELLKSCINFKNRVKHTPLNKLYDLFTSKYYHKRVIKEIKKNLTGY